MKRVIIIVSVVFILLMSLVFFTYPYIKINGKKEITIELNGTYEEKNAVIKKIFGKEKILTTTDKVDTKKVGYYKITYKTKYLFFTIKKIRTVKVEDHKSPEIKLKGKTEVYICPNEEYKEEGYEAIDDADGNITDRVELKSIDDKITYRIKDSSNNETIKFRKIVKKDIEAPIISLKGNKEQTIELGSQYKDLGVKVTDNCDSDIKVTTTGSVNTKKVGTYKITYSAIDSSKNESKVTRTIRVIQRKENITKTVNTIDGKSIIFFGDSITYGYSGTPKGYSWANYIGDHYNVKIKNAGVNGITISEHNNSSLPREVEKYRKNKYDYVILHGGINDVSKGKELGLMTNINNFSGKYNKSTFIGGLEYYLYLVKKQWPNAKIGYIINYKTLKDDTKPGKLRFTNSEKYFLKQKEVLKKWNIKYIDLYWGKNNEGILYSDLLADHIVDKVHINSKGYEIISPYIYNFIKQL